MNHRSKVRLGFAAKAVPMKLHLLDDHNLVTFGLTEYSHQVWVYIRLRGMSREMPMNWILGLNPKP